MAEPHAPLVPPAHLLSLRGGRTLAYSLFGVPLRSNPRGSASTAADAADAAGSHAAVEDAIPQRPRPILHLHGFASSRLEAGLLHADALHHGLSIVAVDRPGAGRSSFNRQQSPEAMAADVEQLLEHLGLEQVTAMGASGERARAQQCGLRARGDA